MDRTLFSSEHDLFRQSFRQFVDREIRPHQKAWAERGMVSREAWKQAGAAGFLCPWLGEEWGGPGADFLCSVVIMEELSYAYESGGLPDLDKLPSYYAQHDKNNFGIIPYGVPALDTAFGSGGKVITDFGGCGAS